MGKPLKEITASTAKLIGGEQDQKRANYEKALLENQINSGWATAGEIIAHPINAIPAGIYFRGSNLAGKTLNSLAKTAPTTPLRERLRA